ncbi:MAG: MipA/OmpV family protein [Burkholderiaceae bacterium]
MKRKVLCGLACALAAGGAHAQEAREQPLWEAGLVSGAVSTPAYPAATERSSRGLALPYFIYRGEVFRADRDGIGARLLRTENTQLDVGFAASLPADSEDVAVRRGMPDLGTLVEFGPRLNVTLARPAPGSRIKLELPLRAVLEFNSGVRGQGFAFEPEVAYETRNIGAGVGLSASASLVFGDRKLGNYFYGVQPQFATATRPAFDASAGLIASRVSLTASRNLNRDVTVFGFVRLESYAGAANKDSPLYTKSSGTSAGFGLAWTLGRSTRTTSSQ